MQTRQTCILCRVAAPPALVYRLLLDPARIALWKVPDGMSCQVHRFEPHEGGRFRISLTYTGSAGVGKSRDRTDTYHGTFVRLRPECEVVERMEFETTDVAMQGTMTATYQLSATAEGTEVRATHRNVPPGISLEDNERGWSMALNKLAALAAVQARGAGEDAASASVPADRVQRRAKT